MSKKKKEKKEKKKKKKPDKNCLQEGDIEKKMIAEEHVLKKIICRRRFLISPSRKIVVLPNNNCHFACVFKFRASPLLFSNKLRYCIV